jgi:gamma-glutamyltranspeptidase/glutathione hydrolase
MLTGSFGSGTIITSVLQVIVNLVDYRMSAQDAVNAPRIHQQWLPDDLAYDEGALSPNVMEKLKEMGYLLTKGTIAGATETILVGGNRLNKPTPNHYVGVNDRRAPVGAAMGYE